MTAGGLGTGSQIPSVWICKDSKSGSWKEDRVQIHHHRWKASSKAPRAKQELCRFMY